MNVKDKVIEILTNMYYQTSNKSSIFVNIISRIKDDSILLKKILWIRIYINGYCDTNPEVNISSNDIEYVINYLESIEIMQELNK
jgi:hypothetical protein